MYNNEELEKKDELTTALYYNLLTNKMPCFSAAIAYTEGQVISPIRFPPNKGSGDSISNLGVKETVLVNVKVQVNKFSFAVPLYTKGIKFIHCDHLNLSLPKLT